MKARYYGREYPIGTAPPIQARVALWYAGFVRYYRDMQTAVRGQRRLPWSYYTESLLSVL